MDEPIKKVRSLLGSIKSYVSSSTLPRMILIVVAILVVLSLVTRSCRCGSTEGFEGLRTVDSYLPNYVVDVQRRCLPGEEDSDQSCIKRGCPPGMERGTGSGSELCYAKCIDGYDSNGMSRCYKKCPDGFETNETTCKNQGHKFKKDVVPCKSCGGTVIAHVSSGNELQARLPAPIRRSAGPVIMTPNTSADWRVTNLVPDAVVWTSFVEGFDGNVVPLAALANPAGGAANGSVSVIPLSELANPALAKPVATTASPKSTQAPASSVPTKVTINLSEPRIDAPMYPCPRGYTLSGDKCYENCPPTYRDTNDGECVKSGYTIDRDSYDRGSGVPFVTHRPKYEQIFHT